MLKHTGKNLLLKRGIKTIRHFSSESFKQVNASLSIRLEIAMNYSEVNTPEYQPSIRRTNILLNHLLLCRAGRDPIQWPSPYGHWLQKSAGLCLHFQLQGIISIITTLLPCELGGGDIIRGSCHEKMPMELISYKLTWATCVQGLWGSAEACQGQIAPSPISLIKRTVCPAASV